MAAAEAPPINVSVAITGHVDAGKTALVRALSTLLSTAALDKNPQSQARGITLDLGFSAFLADVPPRLAAAAGGSRQLQFTLVDCPGHASLIRTIIGGAQIIDMTVLVVDIIKGVQTQTAECLVIAEITTDKLVVVLNKCDLLPTEGRAALVERAAARVRKVLAPTKFANAPFVVLSAAPGGGGGSKAGQAEAPAGNAVATTAAGADKEQSASVRGLVDALLACVEIPERSQAAGPFLFAIDHCFPIKGQGTVLTGTVLAGSLRLNDTIELPALRQERKVKSIQMFKRPVQALRQGDRAGICVTNLDAALVERGLAATPGTVPSLAAVVALVKKIRFFSGPCESEAKFHVTIGHVTVMATAVFFGAQELAAAGIGGVSGSSAAARADADADERSARIVAADSGGSGDVLIPAMLAEAPRGAAAAAAAQKSAAGAAALERSSRRGIPALQLDPAAAWEWQSELMGRRSRAGGGGGAAVAAHAAVAVSAGAVGAAAAATSVIAPARDVPPAPAAAPVTSLSSALAADVVYEWQWAALLFESPVLAPTGSMVIGSKLDSDIHANACRIAFYGRLAEPLPSADVHELRRLNIYRLKQKQGVVDRVESRPEGGVGAFVVVGKGLFKKETDMSQFVGLRVHTRAGQQGVIDSSFGKSGKFRATFASPDRVDAFAAALGAGKTLSEARAAASAPATGVVTAPAGIRPGDALFLRFRKYLFDKKVEGEARVLSQEDL